MVAGDVGEEVRQINVGAPSTASQAARRALLDKKRKKKVERILREIRKSGVRNG